MTQYAKVLFLDADVLPLRNLDHLLAAPALTAPTTTSCCNPNSPPAISGGFWVLAPSAALGAAVWALLARGKEERDGGGAVVGYRLWDKSDMDVMTALFTDPDVTDAAHSVWWPKVADRRHGVLEGLRGMPAYAGLSDAEYGALTLDWNVHAPYPVGFQAAAWDGAGTPWRALPATYDPCAGNW